MPCPRTRCSTRHFKRITMAQAQTVSINKIRADAVLVTRGFIMLCWGPAFVLVMLILPLFRELLGAAPLRSPVIWILVALTPAGLFVANFGIARMTAPYLWVLIGSLTLLAIGGAALVVRCAFRPSEYRPTTRRFRKCSR